MGDYKTEIVVVMNEQISWKFPVRGLTESVSTEILKVFKT